MPYLDTGRSLQGTHPEPSSLHPHAPSQYSVGSVPDAAAGSLRTAEGGGRTERKVRPGVTEHYSASTTLDKT